MYSHPFSDLLKKPVNRREFLLHLGLLALAVTGISGLLKTLSDPDLLDKQHQVSHGFGSGPYGV